jgi:hypothetical protein
LCTQGESSQHTKHKYQTIFSHNIVLVMDERRK